ncbi:MAG: 30S ribosomal protein S12 methylthiotransferase RimO [Nitrospinae bacterium]|nr:30S ribosomal protein S12 methylthiotransferase RimO [Nitrospinota bacterium]
MTQKKKVGIVSLGCPKNRVDTERMLGILSGRGHIITSEEKEADVLIVNTCGFIESAKEESIDAILDLAQYKKNGRCQRLIVTGCLSQRYGRELIDEIPEIDYITGIADPTVISNIVDNDNGIKRIWIEGPAPPSDEDGERILTTPPYTAYVKIAEGCSNRCSFCIIPALRGPFRSRPLESIIKEVRNLADRGVKEINLISQDTTMYGMDLRMKDGLVRLLKDLVNIEGIQWIRLLYCYPTFITKELIDVMGKEEKICRYIDLPLQHIHNDILKGMCRQERDRDIKDLLMFIRDKIPDITIRTTFIVGFPCETEGHFQYLYDFVKEMRFERIGVFTYSREEGTEAGRLRDQVPEKVKMERFDSIMRLQQGISLEHNKRLINTIQSLLVHGHIEPTSLCVAPRQVTDNSPLITGRLMSQAPEVDGIVYLKDSDVEIGEILPIKITGAMEYDLVGEVCKGG